MLCSPTGLLHEWINALRTAGCRRCAVVVVVVQQVLSALRVPLNERRLAVVDAAFWSLVHSMGAVGGESTTATGSARGGRGAKEGEAAAAAATAAAAPAAVFVALQDGVARMHPEKHPEVVARRLSARQVPGMEQSCCCCCSNLFFSFFALLLFYFTFLLLLFSFFLSLLVCV